MLKITYLCLTLLLFSSANAKERKMSSMTLSPHLTELVFSAGGGQSLIGVSAYSNYPEEVKDIPIIGDAFRLDYELIKSLQPDVIFYWKNGTANQVIQQLTNLEFKLFEISIAELDDIPAAIDDIAKILNTTPLKSTQEFKSELASLKSKPSKSQSALIQISNKPIYTVNKQHWMSEAISTCGLDNVYTDLEPLSAAVTLESVILKQPDVIITIDTNTNNPLLNWPQIPAIKNKQVIPVDADTFTRPTLRLLDAIEQLCSSIAID